MPRSSAGSFCLLFVCFLILTSCGQKKYAENEIISEIAYPADPHSFSNPGRVAVKSMYLDLEILWEEHILKGSITYDLKKQEKADTLILDTRNLEIDRVRDSTGTRNLKFWFGPSHELFGRSLNILTSGNSKVIVDYRTTPGSGALQWLTPDQTHDKTDPFIYTQSQAILARTWVPCQDAPSVKFTYSARIKTKPGYMALMSATNPTRVNQDGVYQFVMEQPVSSYLLALASGKLEFQALGRNCGIYTEPGMLKKAAWEFADMQRMVDAAGKLYGTYKWKRYDVLVLPPCFPFGGMENPRLTFATPTVITGDRSLVSLIAHELAHSWSGNLVTNATWNDFWLNEGFTTYFEQRIMEEIYGKPFEQMRRVLAWENLQLTLGGLRRDSLMEDSRLKLDLKDRDPDEGLSDIAYEKGRFFLCHLEETVGRENWDRFLKTYFETHAFRFMDTKGFVDYLNKNLLDKDPAWKKKANVDAWIYGEGLPAGATAPVSVDFQRIETMMRSYLSGELKPEAMDTTGFTTYHRIYMVRLCAGKASLQQIEELDRYFKFSYRGNAELRFEWFQVTITADYRKNRNALRNHLTTIGRRWYILSLYDALAKTTEGKAWATKVFEEAKKGYHSVAARSVADALSVPVSE